MECTMNEYGVLMIEPENAMEKYALGQWRKDPIDKEIVSVFKLLFFRSFL